MKLRQKGISLTELVIVVSLWGLLVVVVIPRYVDLQSKAASAQAGNVHGADRAAATLYFMAGKTRPAHRPFAGKNKDGDDLVVAMDDSKTP